MRIMQSKKIQCPFILLWLPLSTLHKEIHVNALLLQRSSLVMMTVLLLCIAPYSNAKESTTHLAIEYVENHRQNLNDDEVVEKVLMLIQSCPDWGSVPKDDLASRQKILASLREIAGYDVTVIRKAYQKYIYNAKQKNLDDFSNLGRLYVLNRYLFNVPNLVPSEKIISFGGRIYGDPSFDLKTSWLWPLSFDASNNLLLTGTFSLYLGTTYRALEEFDYLHKTFGLRKSHS